MNPQLAALLKAYEAFRDAPPEEAEHLGDIYELGLHDYSKRFGVPLKQLDQALKTRYLRQLRADEKRHRSLPPKA
jgi:Ser/Thr protein kinase RdoA (MazF antagonist)